MPEINVPVTKIFMGKKPVNDSAFELLETPLSSRSIQAPLSSGRGPDVALLLEGGCWH